MLLADHFNELVGCVGVVGVREHVLRGVESNGVFMAAENVDGVAADAHARPRDQASIDGIADGSISGAGALGSHVALGGKAGHQVGLGRLLGQNRAPGNGLLHRLQVFRARMQEQMHVRVNESGEQRGIAEVDDLRARRMVDRFPHGTDPFA